MGVVEKLRILGFNESQLVLEVPGGKQIALRATELEPNFVSTVNALLNSGAKDWNGANDAPLYVRVDVTKDGNGQYVDLALLGLHLEND
ncbi:MAG: hypothetical protein WA071_05570 [Undibacterium umbellatum]|uniref:hypothetical protein n=1 Tax=Undibacterium umbellatum TaxID=2762300 RepID=UPI003BB66DA0